jgi:hypothetical protein
MLAMGNGDTAARSSQPALPPQANSFRLGSAGRLGRSAQPVGSAARTVGPAGSPIAPVILRILAESKHFPGVDPEFLAKSKHFPTADPKILAESKHFPEPPIWTNCACPPEPTRPTFVTLAEMLSIP